MVQQTKKTDQMESLSTAIQKLSLPQELALDLQSRFEPFETQAKEWEAKAKAIVVTDVSQKNLMIEARAARLALRQIRLNVKEKHIQEKAEALKKTQILDLIKRTLDGYIEPLEAHLQEQEDFAKVQTEKRKQQLLIDRMEALKPYRVAGDRLELVPFGEMDQGAFDSLLLGLKAAKEMRENQAKEAERVRLENEQKAKEERERIKLENEKAKLIQSRTQRLMALGFTWDEPSKTYVFPLDDGPITVWGELGEWDENKFNQSLIDATGIINAFRNKKKQEADDLAAKLKAETEAREKLEQENRERLAKEEKERKDKAAADRKLKRAPDKVKLLNFAERISLIEPVEGLKDTEAVNIYRTALSTLDTLVRHVKDQAEKL
jgi:hypothetical protein